MFKADIEIREEEGEADNWIQIQASKVLFFVFRFICSDSEFESGLIFKCVPFWPVQSGKSRLLYVRYHGTKEESVAFPFHESFEAFVPIQNEVRDETRHLVV